MITLAFLYIVAVTPMQPDIVPLLVVAVLDIIVIDATKNVFEAWLTGQSEDQVFWGDENTDTENEQ